MQTAKEVGANVVVSDLSVETEELDGVFNVKCDITKRLVLMKWLN